PSAYIGQRPNDAFPCVEASGRFAFTAKAFCSIKLRLDCRHHSLGDVVLHRKDVGQLTIVSLSPNIIAGFCFNHLHNNAHPVSTSSHRAFQNITHAEFKADLLYVDFPSFVGKARIAGDHEEPADFESAVMISSTMPSAKYSCSGSPLMFAKGSTAIDGLSGRGGLAPGCGIAGRIAVITR